tara:strand:+ start:21046 stop:21411 length:366 start_codon:yes stop_codon:yes gene_type:complete
MPAYIYQILHVTGIIMLFMGYGALLGRSLANSHNAAVRKLGSITSGIGLLLILIAGFGMITKLGYSFTEPWLIVKMVIWLALGGVIALINRKPALAKPLWWSILGLGILAASMVYYVRFQG